MVVLRSIVVILNIVLLIPSIYYFIFGLFPLFIKKKEEKTTYKKNKFKILIAARNEEVVIPNLIESIKKQNYPKELYSILVIANNCTDKTKEVSLKAGAQVLELNKNITCKGDCLNYVFKMDKDDNSFDAYLIFDADNILHPNFLEEINKELEKGYMAVQGFRDTKNLYDSFTSGSYALFFYLQNEFVNKTRTNIGMSANINGTGYALKKELINLIDCTTVTKTEDTELTTILALNNIKVGYTERAICYDEQVEKFNLSFKQRKRWVQGSIQTFKKYYKEIILNFSKVSKIPLIDISLVLLLPFIQIITLFLTLTTTIVFFNLYIMISFSLVLYLSCTVMSLYLTIHYKKNVKKMLPAIFMFAFFNISWMPICLYSVLTKTSKWEVIKHTRNVKIGDILD